jgi:hypothetical protein
MCSEISVPIKKKKNQSGDIALPLVNGSAHPTQEAYIKKSLRVQ